MPLPLPTTTMATTTAAGGGDGNDDEDDHNGGCGFGNDEFTNDRVHKQKSNERANGRPTPHHTNDEKTGRMY